MKTPRFMIDDDVNDGISNLAFDAHSGLFWRYQSECFDTEHPRDATMLSARHELPERALDNIPCCYCMIVRSRKKWRLTEGYFEPVFQARLSRLGVRNKGVATVLRMEFSAIRERLLVRAEQPEIFDVVGIEPPRRVFTLPIVPFSISRSDQASWFKLSASPTQETVLRLLADAVVEVEMVRQVDAELSRRLFGWNLTGW